MLDADKMSKSTGNFLSLDQAMELFGTDGTAGASRGPVSAGL
jgi:leucyl-tRNA synthetase